LSFRRSLGTFLWSLWPPAAGNTVANLAQALMRNKVMYAVSASASSDTANFGLIVSGWTAPTLSGSSATVPIAVFFTSQINAAAAPVFPAGLGLDFYVADELNGCTSAYPALKTMGMNAHAANRSVKDHHDHQHARSQSLQ